MDPDRKSLKDKKFRKGLQKLDTQEQNNKKLVDMTQFVLLSDKKSWTQKCSERNEKNKRSGYAKV